MNIDTWRRLLDHDGHWRVNINADCYKHKTRDLKHRTTDQSRRERARIIGGVQVIS